jgi:hypothetical protein
MGESPLTALAEPHTFKSAALRKLAKANRDVQSQGWWFNTEAITLSPAPVTGHIQLAGDVIKWQSGVRTTDLLVRGMPKPWVVQRGTRLYDTRLRSFTLTEEVVGEVTRLVPYEDLPPVAQDFVSAQAVLRFQSDFDADNSRRQELMQEWQLARQLLNSEQIRQSSVNAINNNVRLQRVKRVTRAARY